MQRESILKICSESSHNKIIKKKVFEQEQSGNKINAETKNADKRKVGR